MKKYRILETRKEGYFTTFVPQFKFLFWWLNFEDQRFRHRVTFFNLDDAAYYLEHQDMYSYREPEVFTEIHKYNLK